MVVPLRVLAVGEEALRKVQIVPGTRHRDIEEAPLLLDLGRGAGTEVRGNAAIDDVQDEDRFPFLALGRVNALRPGWSSPMPGIDSPSPAPRSAICRKNRICPGSRTP
jgi:hypothetical protein